MTNIKLLHVSASSASLLEQNNSSPTRHSRHRWPSLVPSKHVAIRYFSWVVSYDLYCIVLYWVYLSVGMLNESVEEFRNDNTMGKRNHSEEGLSQGHVLRHESYIHRSRASAMIGRWLPTWTTAHYDSLEIVEGRDVGRCGVLTVAVQCATVRIQLYKAAIAGCMSQKCKKEENYRAT